MTWTADQLAQVLVRGVVKEHVGARVVRHDENEATPHKQHVGRPKKAEPKPPKEPAKKWSYEERLAQKLEAAGITGFFVDTDYLPERDLRADVLFPEQRLVVEIQGGAHRIRDKWARDIEKAQATLLAGYRLLPIATAQVRDGTAVDVVRKALAA